MLFVLMLLNKREANSVFICDHLCMFVKISYISFCLPTLYFSMM